MHFFYYVKDLIVKDNLKVCYHFLLYFSNYGSSKFALKYSNSAKFLRAVRPDYDVGVWTHLNLVKEITSSKLRRLWL